VEGQEEGKDKENVKKVKWGLFHLLFIYFFSTFTSLKYKEKKICGALLEMNNIRVGGMIKHYGKPRCQRDGFIKLYLNSFSSLRTAGI